MAKNEAVETEAQDSGDAPLIDLNDASIKKLIARAKKRGFITIDELNEALPQDQMASEQIEDVMSAIPAKDVSTIPAGETVEQQFRRLESSWMAEVGYHSSSTILINHPAFQEIISLGDAVVPLLLRDLEREPHLWVWALPRITGANPVEYADRGNIAKMSEAWVRWGKEQGYSW